jgi:hypothetical protein
MSKEFEARDLTTVQTTDRNTSIDIIVSSVMLSAFDAESAYCSWFDSVRGYRSAFL